MQPVNPVAVQSYSADGRQIHATTTALTPACYQPSAVVPMSGPVRQDLDVSFCNQTMRVTRMSTIKAQSWALGHCPTSNSAWRASPDRVVYVNRIAKDEPSPS